ncbi:MAG: R3H domain-containing nucleic acid-binding protein [Chlamydiota bacterium]
MTDSTAALVKEILEKFMELLSIPGTVSCSYDGTMVSAEVTVRDPGQLIGQGGRGLEALQYLVQRLAGRAIVEGELTPIVVDVDGYRKKREEELSLMAKEIAVRVSGSGRSVLLQPMTAWERKIVHMAVRDEDGLETESEDSETGRRVRIRSKAQTLSDKSGHGSTAPED